MSLNNSGFTADFTTVKAVVKSWRSPLTTNEYIFLQESFEGTGGFKGGEYIAPFPREAANSYWRRVDQAYYLNLIKPIITSLCAPLFKYAPQREYSSGNALFDGFLKNVNGSGQSFNQFMKISTTQSLLLGTTFIVVDNFQEQPDNLETAIDTRSFPFVFKVPPQNVVGYDLDKFGNIELFKYFIKPVSIQSDNGVVIKGLFRTYFPGGFVDTIEDHDIDGQIDTLHGQSLTGNNTGQIDSNSPETSDRLYRHGGHNTEVNAPVQHDHSHLFTLQENAVIVNEGVFDFTDIPVVRYASTDSEIFLPPSSFTQIAKANYRLYNLISEIQNQETNSLFSILTMPETNNDDVNLGTNNALIYPPDASNSPAFIAPDSRPVEVLMVRKEKLIEDIFLMASLSWLTASQDASGEARKWAFERTATAISEQAVRAEQTEKRIGELFEKFTNTSVNLSTNYTRNFGYVDVLNEIDAAIKVGTLPLLGLEAQAELSKRVIKRLYSFEDDESLKRITDSIDEQLQSELTMQESIGTSGIDVSGTDISTQDSIDTELELSEKVGLLMASIKPLTDTHASFKQLLERGYIDSVGHLTKDGRRAIIDNDIEEELNNRMKNM